MPATVPLGYLAIWHDVADGREAEVSDWYNREHHFERLGVPGFLEANRYRLLGSEGRQFFSLYRTETPAVLYSPAYLARLGQPSVRTQAVMPLYRNMSRTICRLDWSAGRAQGGAIATFAAQGTVPGSCRDELEKLAGEPGVLRCRLLVADDAEPPQTPEAQLRGGADARVGWAALVDTNDPQQALDALDRLGKAFPESVALQRAAYRLVFSAR